MPDSHTRADLPKAVLYSWPVSVWCSVPRLALVEKGYGSEEIIIKAVDISKGDQFSTAFLRLNPHGTVPTLVVPLERSLGPDEESQFRALRDSVTITDFIDSSRSPLSKTNTTSSAPAPSLSPATIEGSNISKAIISLLHDSKGADPNFLKRSARTPAELQAGKAVNTALFANRQEAIEASLSEQPEGVTSKLRTFLEGRSESNKVSLDIWSKGAESVHAKEFMESSKTLWEVTLPDTFKKLDELIIGPFCLGDQLSVADLHLAAWLARAVSVCGGTAKAEDVEKVEEKIGLQEFKIGQKVKMFWAAMIVRPSFKAVYPGGVLH
ncbi:hypothetical protein DACRYDRAFT_84120 [Dacryopinax primogenitus]|uniref:GST N-terminal domain-containing protein n=1 Tax=Dacryopinax primogenitus (strain DJM 731) TaxID=1858805 RepID=M5FRV2_DACPD|nr:uncharacterized protein DACRYDRAFT_84120 [Dacryopinax primogenitus]EJT97784.1 hypothetical protein DACRYDRAFT_84120 [Dacryopinax primogenitus]